MTLYHNLFFNYRGPETDDYKPEQQLENNVTKALINTLEHGGEAVWRPFLEFVGLHNPTNPAFLLQRGEPPNGPGAKRRRLVLLGISSEASQWTPEMECKTSKGTIPDAWIFGDNFAVLVESKVAGDFGSPQMQGHMKRLQLNGESEPRVILKTWREVHLFFHRLLPTLADVPAFLVRQLVQFLEYSGLSGFNGFRREHFAYFESEYEDDVGRRWVQGQVSEFAARLLDRLREIDEFYEAHDAGMLYHTDQYCWVAFGLKDREYRQYTHQTIDISAAGIRAFVNTELQRATEPLKRILREQKSRDEFRAKLKDLHAAKPFELVLHERINVQVQKFKYEPRKGLSSPGLADDGDKEWNLFAERVTKINLPYLRIERPIPTQALLNFTDDQAVEAVVEVFRINHPVVKFLNDPKWRK